MHYKDSPGWRFEQLVADLLRALGYANVRSNVQAKGAGGLPEELDIVYEKEGLPHVAEVKFYRYSSPPRAELLMKAILQTYRKKRLLGASSALLAISCPMSPALKLAAKESPNIEIWDADELFRRASDFPELSKEFENIFEASAPVHSQPEITMEFSQDNSFREMPKTGRLLAEALLSVPPGKQGSSDFETACINALKYLFELDLHGWHEQLNTDDELHRRDLICRILPKAEIWNLMLTDVGSRYVIFEFKNYTNEITQKEIVTTERYLYPSALRNVAIIISPKGCTASATKVIQGAMRESGKMILSLSVSEIEELLVAKDDGGDPNTYLFEKVDQFLMRLGR
ncbi:restriction endonuclease [Pseudomonas aeruginosa]|uniref:restriction endonuclease n=1 Tax=Pseudomonas aeruginosa TaxID=287 RepID=UPI0021171BFD|nr:restriction endonuclease [Pseudomonas aeruginosa]UUH88030.1 restriction endonuclease [Pseudomonas aeruginosa]HCR1326654.1 restriction endonuclease [Pseudomonas aeruginosa]